MDGVNPLLPISNRPGLFAVVTREIGETLAKGYMKLYWTPHNIVLVETITRNRKPLANWDPDYRVVFVALDQDGRLTWEGP